MGWVVWAAGKVGWYFFAWGPQLLICLYLGYLCAKRTGGDLLDWLVAAFVASLVPIAGVIVMLAVWWRAGDDGTARRPGGRSPSASSSGAADSSLDEPSASTASELSGLSARRRTSPGASTHDRRGQTQEPPGAAP